MIGFFDENKFRIEQNDSKYNKSKNGRQQIECLRRKKTLCSSETFDTLDKVVCQFGTEGFHRTLKTKNYKFGILLGIESLEFFRNVQEINIHGRKLLLL